MHKQGIVQDYYRRMRQYPLTVLAGGCPCLAMFNIAQREFQLPLFTIRLIENRQLLFRQRFCQVRYGSLII